MMFFDEKFKLEFDPLAYLFENEIDELFRIDSFKKQYNNITLKASYKIDRDTNEISNKASYKIDREFKNNTNFAYYRLGLLQPPPKRIIVYGFDD